MGRRVKETIKKVNKVTEIVGSHHTGAYAAQAAYFFVLSMIPIILLLLTAVQFTPATYANVIDAVEQVFPTSVQGFIRSIVTQVYFSQSAKIIPITILVALWSAGRGVLSVTNYVYLRLRASLYTVIFILAIVLSLVLSVFGNSISAMIYKHAPFWSTLMQYIIKIRTVMTLAVLTVFWDLVYKYLPNRRATQKTTLRKQLPGAVFTACGWLLISFIFSIYLDIFEGFSDMYGSMTTIVLIMLWLYLCMYVILLGGEVNALLEKYLDNHKNCDKIIK